MVRGACVLLLLVAPPKKDFVAEQVLCRRQNDGDLIRHTAPSPNAGGNETLPFMTKSQCRQAFWDLCG